MIRMADLARTALLVGLASPASAECLTDWDLGSRTHAPFERALAERVPNTVILGRVDEAAKLDAEVRPLAELAPLLNVWFHDRSTEELFRVLFTGPAGDTAPAMAQALAAMGATRQAGALGGAIGDFGRRFPDSAKRSALFGPYAGPPTEIGRAVFGRAGAFGSRADFVGALAAYACTQPAVVAWLDAERSRMSEQDRLAWLGYELLTTRHIDGPPETVAAELGKLPEPYRTLYLVRYVDFEVGNGGVHQFFSNSSGALAPHVPEALRRIGAPKHAEIIERGLAMFAAPYPTERAERDRLYFGATDPRTGKPKGMEPGDGWGTFDDELATLTDQGWDYEAIEPAALAFARREGVVPR